MEDLLIEVLSEFGYLVRLQGSFLEDKEYPKSFFTFWNSSSEDTDFYDDRENAAVYEYDVNFYSSDFGSVDTVIKEAIGKLKSAGFIITDTGHSVASDMQSHIGKGIEILYKKKGRKVNE